MSGTQWSRNDQGLWCDACGNHIAEADEADADDYTPPDSCDRCGFPDFEDGTDYFTDDDDDAFDHADDDDGEDLDEECGMSGDGYCSLAGTEHCDWICPHSRGGG